MNRIEFDALIIKNQIEFINGQLQQEKTLTDICKEINIGRSTIRERFKKNGYEFSKSQNKYIYMIEIVETKDNNTTFKTVTSNSSKGVVATDSSNLNDFNEILSNFNEMNNKLNEVYKWYESQSSRDVVVTDKLQIDDFEKNIVVRSYKIYENIQKEFTIFCEKNKKYRVQDIISQALKEFMEKYKI